MKKSIKINAILSVIQKCCHILFPLIIFPYVSRVLGPQNYGKFSFAQSINSYFLVTAMLGVSTYSIREGARIRDDKRQFQKFASEVSTINIVSLCLSYAVMLIMICFNDTLHEYSGLLLILSLILPCTYLGRDWINTVYEDYLYITIRYVVVQLVGIFCIFGVIHNEEDYVKYTVIYTLTASIGYIINLYYTRKYLKFQLTTKPNFKKHLPPILTLFCGQIATSIYVQSDITMLGIFVNETAVGVYSVASKIYVLIKGIINAITTVTIPRVVYYLGKEDKEQYNRFANIVYECLVTLVVPMTIGLFVFSENLLLLVGGTPYSTGYWTLQILSIALLFAVFSGFYCNAIMVPNRKEKDYFITTVIAALINIALNIVLIPYIGMEGAALTTLISEIVVFILAIRKTKPYLDIKINKRNIVTVLLGSALVLVVCVISRTVLENYVAELLTAIVISVVVYAFFLLLFGNELAIYMFNQITDLLKKTRRNENG